MTNVFTILENMNLKQLSDNDKKLVQSSIEKTSLFSLGVLLGSGIITSACLLSGRRALRNIGVKYRKGKPAFFGVLFGNMYLSIHLIRMYNNYVYGDLLRGIEDIEGFMEEVHNSCIEDIQQIR